MHRESTRIMLTGEKGIDKLAVYLWKPRGNLRGVVQIIHGMREHMGRYGHFASFLNTQGYALIGHDQMGHGRSGSGDAAFGFFGEKNGPQKLIKDSRRVTSLIRHTLPGLPIFLLGHSMGSFVGRLYILHYAEELSGFICMGTGGEQRLASVGRALAEILVRLKGAKNDGKFLDGLTFSGYNRCLRGSASKMAWLSRDEKEVEKFDWDAMIRPYFTNAGFRDLYELQMSATGKDWAKHVDKSLPILLTSGGEDPVGGYGKGVVQVYERLKMAGVLDVECKIYEGARHELLNEINREEVYYDIYSWMEDHRE